MSESRDRYYLKELKETAQKYPESLCVRNAIVHLEKRLELPLTREFVDPIAFLVEEETRERMGK